MTSGDSFSIDIPGTRSVVSNVDGLVSSGTSTAGDLGSMTLDSTAFAGVGSEVASANSAMQSQLNNALSQSMKLFQQTNNNVGLAVDNYAVADQSVADSYGGIGQVAQAPSAATPPDPGPPPPLPDAGSNPDDVKQYWSGLTQDQKQALTETQPDRVGALDGVPVATRDYANRLNLTDQINYTQSQLDSLKANPPSGVIFDDAGTAQATWQQQVNDSQTKLDGLNQVQKMIGPDRPFPTSDIPTDTPQPTQYLDAPPTTKYLLGVDTEGPGHAIIASNNPDASTNVVTVIPGAETQLQAGSVATNVVTADRLVGAADAAGSPSTSVVSWMNYNAPSSAVSLSAYGSGAAVDAAPAFDRFQQGLYDTNGSPSTMHSTVVGYSYGSVVAGDAATAAGGFGNVHVNDVVSLGSPGMDVPNAAALGVPPGSPGDPGYPHVWAARGENDVVQYAFGHGPDPISPTFGANVIEPPQGLGLFSGGAAHSGYFSGATLDQVGAIAAGRYDLVTPQSPPRP